MEIQSNIIMKTEIEKNIRCDPSNENNSIGRILTINYEGDKVKSIQDSTGRIVTYTYNNSGMLETVKDLNGNIQNICTTLLMTRLKDRDTDLNGFENK